MRWQNNGADLPVVGSFERYVVSTLSVLRLLVRLGVLSGLLRGLSVASLLVDMDLLTVLRRVLLRVLCVLCVLRVLRVLCVLYVLCLLLGLLVLLGRLLVLRVLLLLLLGRLGTTQALFFVDADLFCDVGVVLLGSVDGSGEGLVYLFRTFPSV
jgi:hypothetical protein